MWFYLLHIDVYVGVFYIISFLRKGNDTINSELNKKPYYSHVLEHVKMYEHYKYLNTKCVRDMLFKWWCLGYFEMISNKQMLINFCDNHPLVNLKQKIITILYITNLAQYISMSCNVKKLHQRVQINVSGTQLYVFKVVILMYVVFNDNHTRDGSSSCPN